LSPPTSSASGCDVVLGAGGDVKERDRAYLARPPCALPTYGRCRRSNPPGLLLPGAQRRFHRLEADWASDRAQRRSDLLNQKRIAAARTMARAHHRVLRPRPQPPSQQFPRRVEAERNQAAGVVRMPTQQGVGREFVRKTGVAAASAPDPSNPIPPTEMASTCGSPRALTKAETTVRGPTGMPRFDQSGSTLDAAWSARDQS
jgi:hypothetical protein